MFLNTFTNIFYFIFVFRLNKFEKTNEMLINCNSLSTSYYDKLQSNFRRNTQLMEEIHKDLNYIFRTIRSIKQTIKVQHPEIIIPETTDRNFSTN